MTVDRACYVRVPVAREVTETCMVTEVQNRMVPVVHWRMVPEQRLEEYPVTVVRMINQTVRVRVPRTVTRCVPKSLVYKTAVLTCEEIPVTVYRPVVKMVPVVAPCPQAVSTPQGLPEPSDQPVASTPRPTPGLHPPFPPKGGAPRGRLCPPRSLQQPRRYARLPPGAASAGGALGSGPPVGPRE